MKHPLTPAGIEPATFRFVAQHRGGLAVFCHNKTQTHAHSRARTHTRSSFSMDTKAYLNIMIYSYWNSVWKFKEYFINAISGVTLVRQSLWGHNVTILLNMRAKFGNFWEKSAWQNESKWIHKYHQQTWGARFGTVTLLFSSLLFAIRLFYPHI